MDQTALSGSRKKYLSALPGIKMNLTIPHTLDSLKPFMHTPEKLYTPWGAVRLKDKYYVSIVVNYAKVNTYFFALHTYRRIKKSVLKIWFMLLLGFLKTILTKLYRIKKISTKLSLNLKRNQLTLTLIVNEIRTRSSNVTKWDDKVFILTKFYL